LETSHGVSEAIIYPVALMSKINWKAKLTRTHAAVGGVAFLGLMALVNAPGPGDESPSPADVKAVERRSTAALEQAQGQASQAPQAVRPEHEGLPSYTEPGAGEYLVRLEPVGAAGELWGAIASPDSDEVTPLVSNCLDIRQKLSRADLLVGESVGEPERFADYSQWILRGAVSLCGDQATSQAPAPPAETAMAPAMAAENPEPTVKDSLIVEAVVNAGDGSRTCGRSPARNQK
jgi:hypothetical protein